MTDSLETMYKSCTLCPRSCQVDRLSGQKGFCGQTAQITAARAALHFWEEPCISGISGSGTVFFCGCNLKCIFCQNAPISSSEIGLPISVSMLSDLFLSLEEQGAHNINLVTAGHFLPSIIEALTLAKNRGLSIPIVYNTSGYEEVSSLALLDGLIDVYLPDLKYHSSDLSGKYSAAEDYFSKASSAIEEMVRQVGKPIFAPLHASGHLTDQGIYSREEVSETGLMKKGVIVRHLVLPGCSKDSRYLLHYLCETFGDSIWISLLNQYTPMPRVKGDPRLDRTVTKGAYDSLVSFLISHGMEQVFIQDGQSASESFIPLFNYEGLL